MKKFFASVVLPLVFFALTACGGGQDEALFGEWLWNADGAYIYVFNYDGTGERGFPETRETFTWNTNGDRLNISRDRAFRREIRNESWTFEIADSVLTIENRNVADVVHSYVFNDGEIYAALIGEWAWDLSPSYLYIFSSDGVGERGFPGEKSEFSWSVTDDRLFIERHAAPHGEIRGELWTFDLYDDTLTITSLQEEIELTYTRTR